MKNLLGLDDAFEDDMEAQYPSRNSKNKKRGTKTKKGMKGKKGKKGNRILCCLTND